MIESTQWFCVVHIPQVKAMNTPICFALEAAFSTCTVIDLSHFTARYPSPSNAER